MSRERSVVDVSEVVPNLRCCYSAVTPTGMRSTQVGNEALGFQARKPTTASYATTFHRFMHGRQLTIWLIQHEWDILSHTRAHDLLKLRIRSRMRAREGMVVTKHAGQLALVRGHDLQVPVQQSLCLKACISHTVGLWSQKISGDNQGSHSCLSGQGPLFPPYWNVG
jgi:hypothetical protein